MTRADFHAICNKAPLRPPSPSDASVTRNGWWVDDITVMSHEDLCDANPCGVPGEVSIISVSKDAGDVILEWWDDPVCQDFMVWRSSDPSTSAAFDDVTSEDPDPVDYIFRDTSGGGLLYWIIQGSGPDGDGPWGHYGL